MHNKRYRLLGAVVVATLLLIVLSGCLVINQPPAPTTTSVPPTSEPLPTSTVSPTQTLEPTPVLTTEVPVTPVLPIPTSVVTPELTTTPVLTSTPVPPTPEPTVESCEPCEGARIHHSSQRCYPVGTILPSRCKVVARGWFECVKVTEDGEEPFILVSNRKWCDPEPAPKPTLQPPKEGCAYEWVDEVKNYPPSEECPGEAQYGPVIRQEFEQGFMIWLGTSPSYVFVFYDDGQFALFEDRLNGDGREHDGSVGPSGAEIRPALEFEATLDENPPVYNRLGAALECEQAYDGWCQWFTNVVHLDSGRVAVRGCLVKGAGDIIYNLSWFSHIWEQL